MGVKLHHIAAFSILILFLCSCGVGPDATKVQNVTPEIEPGPKKENQVEQKEEPVKEKPVETIKEEFYGAEELIKDLKKIIKGEFYEFKKDPSYPDFIRESQNKYYAIQTLSNEAKTFREYCDRYCLKNWDDFDYYINKSDLDTYIPIMTNQDFPNEAKYKQYLNERIFANYTKRETIHKLENGYAIENQIFLVAQSMTYEFEGNLMPYVSVYRVPCTKNMTVFLRPKWEEFTIEGNIGSVSEVVNNWELEDARVRESMLNMSNEILKACNVKDDYFDGYVPENYHKSENLAYHWRNFYAELVKIDRNMSLGIRRSNDEFELTDMNFSFRNMDVFEIYNIGLRIDVITDGKNEEEYINIESVGTIIGPGDGSDRQLNRKDIAFKKNITVIASLYTLPENVDVRPLTLTLTEKDLESIP